MKTGIELIFEERQRQIKVEGWTAEHDARHELGELAKAAKCYEKEPSERVLQDTFFNRGAPIGWPWESEWWKPCPDNRLRELVKAGGLYVAANEAEGNDTYIDDINRVADKIDFLLNSK